MQKQTDLGLDSPPSMRSLRELAAAEQACRRCPLYQDATQAVPGEGRKGAHLMLVGEQPGDKEDIAGKPFVGPAGRMLDEALAEAGIPREEVFVTNAVKHFKHEMRGKRRLHKRPSNYEIERCKVWLENERSLIKPAAGCARRDRRAQPVRPYRDHWQDARTCACACRWHCRLCHHPSVLPAAHQGARRQGA